MKKIAKNKKILILIVVLITALIILLSTIFILKHKKVKAFNSSIYVAKNVGNNEFKNRNNPGKGLIAEIKLNLKTLKNENNKPYNEAIDMALFSQYSIKTVLLNILLDEYSYLGESENHENSIKFLEDLKRLESSVFTYIKNNRYKNIFLSFSYTKRKTAKEIINHIKFLNLFLSKDSLFFINQKNHENRNLLSTKLTNNKISLVAGLDLSKTNLKDEEKKEILNIFILAFPRQTNFSFNKSEYFFIDKSQTSPKIGRNINNFNFGSSEKENINYLNNINILSLNNINIKNKKEALNLINKMYKNAISYINVTHSLNTLKDLSKIKLNKDDLLSIGIKIYDKYFEKEVLADNFILDFLGYHLVIGDFKYEIIKDLSRIKFEFNIFNLGMASPQFIYHTDSYLIDKQNNVINTPYMTNLDKAIELLNSFQALHTKQLIDYTNINEVKGVAISFKTELDEPIIFMNKNEKVRLKNDKINLLVLILKNKLTK